MSALPEKPARFVRRTLSETNPDRRAGGFYRTAQDSNNEALGGIPLVSSEAALTAAVRLGYRVAAAQVDRSADWARRLRSAGDQAVGPNSERHAVDAAEKLVFKSLLSGLEWLEGVTAEQGSPIRRLITTEYQWLGALLGIDGKAGRKTAESVAPGAMGSTQAAALIPPANAVTRLRIKHAGVPRAVTVAAWDCDPIESDQPISLFFVARGDPLMQVSAELTVPKKGIPALLALQIRKESPSDTYTAAICDEQQVQVGFIEIRF